MKEFNEQEGLTIVSSPDDLISFLKEYRRPEKIAVGKDKSGENSVKKIVDIILSKKSNLRR